MKLTLSSKIPSLILLSLFIFFAVFAPPLIGETPMGYFVMLIMLVYIGYNLLLHGNMYTFKKSSLHFFYGFLPFLSYIFICTVYRVTFCFDSNEISPYIINFRKVLATVIYLTLTYISLKYYMGRNKRLTKVGFIKIIVGVGLLQTFLIFLSHFNEGVHSLFVDFVLKSGGSDIMQEILSNQNNYERLVGLSAVPFDALSYLMTGISLIVFSAGLYCSKKSFLCFSFLIIAASTLAARTGILLFLIGVAFISIRYIRETRSMNFRAIIKCIFVFLIIVFLSLGFYMNMPDNRKKSFEAGLHSVQVLIIDREAKGVFSQILLEDIVFPDDILFGIGAKPETLGHFDNTGGYIDNGYIQVVWRFGVLGLILLIFGHVYFYKTIYSQSQDLFVKGLVVALASSTVLYYIKQYPLNTNGTNLVYFVFPLILNAFNKYETKEEKNNGT